MHKPLEMAVHQVFANANFIVTSSSSTAAPSFEINTINAPLRTAFLYGASANYLLQVINQWQVNVPQEEEVEEVLESLMWCNANPLVIH
jgi:uncharacterized membrane protein YoaT (DUF817 family)